MFEYEGINKISEIDKAQIYLKLASEEKEICNTKWWVDQTIKLLFTNEHGFNYRGHLRETKNDDRIIRLMSIRRNTSLTEPMRMTLIEQEMNREVIK